MEKDPAARDGLHLALKSRYLAVREAAALELASKKDPAAFESLVGLLKAAGDPKPQRRVIEALVTLGDPRAAGAFLDRVEDDPGGTALADELLAAVGRFRLPEVVDRLLALMDKDRKRRDAAVGALITISGYDQWIGDLEDEGVDRSWEEKQFPRHDAVLARLMDRLSAPADSRHLLRLLPGARWARGKEVDPVLAGLVNHPDDSARQRAVEALGWRLRKREGDPEPLRKALQHKDPITQFLAAEGLAKAGRAEGLNVLLASIDFAGDLDLRRRAVLALGELADERALDALLRLAGEDGHALQEPAAEAIGHLGRSPRAEEIFKLLERFAKGDTGVAWCALQGLRWLDTRAGWQLIRQRAASPTSAIRARASSSWATMTTPPPATCCSACSRETKTRRSSRRPWSAQAPLGQGIARSRLCGHPERGSLRPGRVRRDARPRPRPGRAPPSLRDPPEVPRRGARVAGDHPRQPGRAPHRRGAVRPREPRPDHRRDRRPHPRPGRLGRVRRGEGAGGRPEEVASGLGGEEADLRSGGFLGRGRDGHEPPADVLPAEPGLGRGPTRRRSRTAHGHGGGTPGGFRVPPDPTRGRAGTRLGGDDPRGRRGPGGGRPGGRLRAPGGGGAGARPTGTRSGRGDGRSTPVRSGELPSAHPRRRDRPGEHPPPGRARSTIKAWSCPA